MTRLLGLIPVLLGLVTQSLSAFEDSWWNLGTIPFEGDCTKVGFPALPGFDDSWMFNAHCFSYHGTVGCIDDKCRCSQGDDAYFDDTFVGSWYVGICRGKVGAFCSAEKSSFIPDKICTPNADCVPISIQGEPRGLGRCQCLYGYKSTEEGTCVVDDDIWEGHRSTPRTMTTTEAPEKDNFSGPWDHFFNYTAWNKPANFGESCNPTVMFNRTYCNSYEGTVSCVDGTCQCNEKDDRVWDGEFNQCVGLVGTYCNNLRYCVEGADCEMEGYTGSCRCLYGYRETEERLCERDPSIPDPSTRPTVPTTERTTTPMPNGCPPSGVDKIPHPTECAKYFVCVNGAAYEQECADDLHFNPGLKECDFQENVNCTKPLPECPPDGVSFHPYPGNCSLYVICAEGTPIVQECAPDTCFDPEELKCRAIDNTSFDIPEIVNVEMNFEYQVDVVTNCENVASHGLILIPGKCNDERCGEFSVCDEGVYKVC